MFSNISKPYQEGEENTCSKLFGVKSRRIKNNRPKQTNKKPQVENNLNSAPVIAEIFVKVKNMFVASGLWVSVSPPTT